MLDEDKQNDANRMGSSNQKRRSLFSVLFHPRASKTTSTESSELEITNSNNNSPDEVGNEHWSDDSGDEFVKDLDNSNTQRRTSNTVQDQDSYVLDLNERLAKEKLNNGESSEDEGNRLKRKTKESDPNNQSIKEIRDHIYRSASSERFVDQSKVPQTNRSPLLEQFLKSHKIQLDSTQLNDESVRSELNLISSSSSSDPSSLASIELRPDDFERASLLTPVQDRAARERDLRLVHWRLKAAKSIWSANSLPSSDSELDLLDCQSPALVISCSDDTSCSSVDFIWTPRDSAVAENRDELFKSPNLTSEEIKREAVLHQVMSSTDEYSPARAQQRFLHRLSIFELAKPSRAKGRRTSARVSPMLTDGAQWVPNPLFGIGSAKNSSKKIIKSASYESVVAKQKEFEVQESISRNENKHLEPDACLLSDDKETIMSDEDQLDGSQSEEYDLTTTVKKVKSKRAKSSSADGRKRDNIYLNHIISLNRGIKSNVSSIKSQLSVKISDTGKRASILADQLISTIKDTTKEQLFSGWPAADRTASSGINASTFSIPQNVDSNMIDPDTRKKTQLFSLIYMHQQQANGQPVITRQPMPVSGLSSLSKPASPSSDWPATDQDSIKKKQQQQQQRTKIPPPRPAPPKLKGGGTSDFISMQITGAGSKVDISKTQGNDDESSKPNSPVQGCEEFIPASKSVSIQTSPVPELAQSKPMSTSVTNPHSLGASFSRRRNNNRYSTTSSATATRRRRHRKSAKLVYSGCDVGDDDDDDDDGDFYHNEYIKSISSLAAKDDSTKHQSRIRTLNYWRRYKMRKLGAEDDKVRVYARDRSHSLDLSDLRSTGAR